MNAPVYVRPHGQLARLFLWALPVDVLIVLLACWGLGGCAKRQPRLDSGEYYRLPLEGGHTVYFITAKDGTRCAVYGDGGIACDWSRRD